MVVASMLGFVAVGAGLQWAREAAGGIRIGAVAFDLFGLSIAYWVILLVVAMHLLPIIVAVIRKHPNTAPIVVVTVLAGWTLVGYVVALAWSFTAFDRRERW